MRLLRDEVRKSYALGIEWLSAVTRGHHHAKWRMKTAYLLFVCSLFESVQGYPTGPKFYYGSISLKRGATATVPKGARCCRALLNQVASSQSSSVLGNDGEVNLHGFCAIRMLVSSLSIPTVDHRSHYKNHRPP
ncbi:hypothetical protein FPOAC2_10945 [Fusarium poae]